MMRLIPEWRQAPRMLSVQFTAALGAWLALPEAQQSAVLNLVPGLTPGQVSGALVVMILIGRLITQPKISTRQEDL